MIANTPKPPYYAVIFSSMRTTINDNYSEEADKMVELAKVQDGFLGVEFARNELGITVSYWKDLESIKKWKENTDHSIAREKGRKDWYSAFKTRIAKVERDYEFERD
ncbi:MAG: antibiotic biosynthesis monooxygenase [Cyclobacteriaceae bacterium]